MRRHTASGTKQGSIVLNPGGPGAPGGLPGRFRRSSLGQRLRARFDLVAFDPRGVGHSTQVRCADDPLPYLTIDKNPHTAFEYRSMVATMQDYAARCAARNGDLLAHVSTLDVVRDMERIWQALGEGPLNYIGLSYGSKMGALYADTYPQNARHGGSDQAQLAKQVRYVIGGTDEVAKTFRVIALPKSRQTTLLHS